MPAALRGLAANLVAGLRLALLLPVARTAFRIDAAQLVLLVAVSALVDVGADWLRHGPEAAFNVAAIGSELASFALLVAAAALIAWALREPPLVAALPTVLLASMPIVQAASVVPFFAALDEDRAPWIVEAAYLTVLAWFLLVLGRGAFAALQPHVRRAMHAVATTVVLAAPLALPPGVLLEASWWEPYESAVVTDTASPAAEPVLALQRELHNEALAALEEHVQGETDLYFVAFAPDGDGMLWSARVEQARKVMDGHWRTQRRSLVYANDPARLGEMPMATVTHLREALEELAAVMDPEEDVVMLYLAGRSNPDGSMTALLPPLGLVQLSGAGLAALLDQAGLRWRVVVVATCDPQPFVEALADARTLVMAAGGDGRRAAGCASASGAPTDFGDVLFGEALPVAASLPAAFDAARVRLAGRGPAPVMRMGEEIAEQLAKLRGAGGARAAFSASRRG